MHRTEPELAQPLPRPRPEPLRKELIQETHGFIFREYGVSYRFPDEDKTRDQTTTRQRIAELMYCEASVAEIRSGAFGWRWVSDVRAVPPI